MNEILVVKIPVKKKGESVHMKKVVAMYEQEEAYGKNLAEYVNRKENMPFELQVFSQADKLSDYLQGHTPQLLLLSEESSLESYGEMSVKTQDVLYLTEHKEQARDHKENHIYKYQPTDQLLNQLMQRMSDRDKRDSPVMQESCPIYGVYSPVGRCGKTTFSLLLGELLARKRQSYISVLMNCRFGMRKRIHQRSKVKRNAIRCLFLLAKTKIKGKIASTCITLAWS